ncbi:hypothetical protein PPTG_21267 [Phytophthora nicotianae INRA-310]|uniref:Uncharacterized protein n=1 Tax=Phytophthora nicotianae (strain INRA-310) TaxID=761204 RepID=W2R6G6_PHYN3|nr:hypothetical protein PPTG_21267 [Phytophthora nicotianae INRA-310]ETN20284.1 hypothetical protein PPTG_21267 [Phytophthora nicotianae INRA-310]
MGQGRLGEVRAQTVAIVEERRRREAQHENAVLKEQLRNCLRKREELQTALAMCDVDQLYRTMAVSSALGVELGTGKQLRFSHLSIWNLLERRIDARISELDAVFIKMETETAPARSEFRTCNTNAQNGAVAFLWVELLPFDNHTIASMILALAKSGKFPDGEQVQAEILSEDVVAITVVSTIHLNSGGSIEISGHKILKRFDRPKGCALLTETCSEWTLQLPNSGTWTYAMQEEGCFAIREDLSGELCQNRSELRLRPSEFAGHERKHPMVNPCMVREVVVSSFRGLVQARQQFNEITNYVMPSLSPSPGACDDLLESFLHDMDTLDHCLSKPATSNLLSASKKRKQEALAAHPSQNRTEVKKKQPSWLKRKQELEALRQQTQAMETRVVYLEMKQSSPNKNLNAFNVQKAKSSALVEKQRCIAAQNENMQLRAMLQFYTRQYEAFQMAIASGEYQLKELQSITSGALRVEMGAGRQLRACGTQVFDMMERRLDTRFHELEYAYRAMQQPMISTDTETIQTRNERGAVEFTRLELLPFEEEAISSTMWSFIEEGRFPDGEQSIVSRRSDDILAVNTRVAVQIDCGSMVTIDTHGVVKRFMTGEGYAVLMEGYSEWTVDSPASGMWHHTTREGGCFVMRDYSVESGTSSGICQARSLLCLYPDENYDTTQSYLRSEENSIREVVISSYSQLIKSRHQFVQNALFDTIRS